jgi:hypothetical protein
MFIENPLNSSMLAFPILECFHIIGFTLSVGTIGLVDLRLLGIGMNRQTPAEVAEDTKMWTLGGLALMLLSGLMLFSSDPDMYYLNMAFVLKMICLALAIAFNYTIHRQAVSPGASPGRGKLLACISLALWTGVLFGGIYIGFIEEGLSFHNL